MQKPWGREGVSVREHREVVWWRLETEAPRQASPPASLPGQVPCPSVLGNTPGTFPAAERTCFCPHICNQYSGCVVLLGYHSDVLFSYPPGCGNQVPLWPLLCCFQKRTLPSRFYGPPTLDEKNEFPGPESFLSPAPRSRPVPAECTTWFSAPTPYFPAVCSPAVPGSFAHDVLLLGPTGLPPKRGTPCCCITAALTRSTTSSPWRLWANRCSSPSQQVRPPP